MEIAVAIVMPNVRPALAILVTLAFLVTKTFTWSLMIKAWFMDNATELAAMYALLVQSEVYLIAPPVLLGNICSLPFTLLIRVLVLDSVICRVKHVQDQMSLSA